MIEYKIISRRITTRGTSPSKREKITAHKQDIYNRIVRKWKHRFNIGDEVHIKGTKQRGTIVGFRDENTAIWNGMNPHWIEVQLQGGNIEVATARQIQR